MSKKREFTIRKVPLEAILELLNNMFAQGADYVDMHGLVDDEGKQDRITVSTKDEYMNEDFLGQQEKEEIPPIDTAKYEKYTPENLNDDDIDNLIDHGL